MAVGHNMAAFTFTEILACTGGALAAGEAVGRVRGVSTDTRSLRRGELFVAIRGKKFDGHDLLKEAAQQGAAALLVCRRDIRMPPGVAVICVKDTVKALGHMARHHRDRFNIPVIAITGSAGKTSTKELIAAVLRKKYRVLCNQASHNNHMGVPQTLLRLTPRHEAAVIEMGTNHPGEIAWLAEVARPTMAVVTNVGASHLEGLGSPEGVYREKLSLLGSLPKQGPVILNADDRYWSRLLKRKGVVSYGIRAKADVRAQDITAGKGKVFFRVARGGRFCARGASKAMVYNALAAIACGRLMKVPELKIRQALARAKPAKGRQRALRANGVSVIDDTYNANPLSYSNAIDMLGMASCPGRRVLVAGDMLELGRASGGLHRDTGRQAAAGGVDALFAFGPGARLMFEAARRDKPGIGGAHFRDQERLIKGLQEYLRRGDILLVKGSRGMRMEKVVENIMVFLKG